jgi:hypothetical protein
LDDLRDDLLKMRDEISSKLVLDLKEQASDWRSHSVVPQQ